MGNTPKAWFTVALAVTILMLLFQLFTLFGVRERKDMFRREEEKTTLRGMWEVLTKMISSCGPPLPCRSLISAT